MFVVRTVLQPLYKTKLFDALFGTRSQGVARLLMDEEVGGSRLAAPRNVRSFLLRATRSPQCPRARDFGALPEHVGGSGRGSAPKRLISGQCPGLTTLTKVEFLTGVFESVSDPNPSVSAKTPPEV